MKKLLLAILVTGAFSANAQIVYKSEKNGVTVYSNAPTKGATRVDLPQLSVLPSIKGSHNASSSGSSKQSSGAPQSSAQHSREMKREEVLQEELNREQTELDKAEKELAAQEAIRNGDEKNYQKVADRLQPYKEAVALHKKNVEAIKKEQAIKR